MEAVGVDQVPAHLGNEAVSYESIGPLRVGDVVEVIDHARVVEVSTRKPESLRRIGQVGVESIALSLAGRPSGHVTSSRRLCRHIASGAAGGKPATRVDANRSI
jgi:hypothetical protein